MYVTRVAEVAAAAAEVPGAAEVAGAAVARRDQQNGAAARSLHLDRPVLNTPHDCRSGVTAVALPVWVSRSSGSEGLAVTEPNPLAVFRLDAADRLALDVKRPTRAGCGGSGVCPRLRIAQQYSQALLRLERASRQIQRAYAPLATNSAGDGRTARICRGARRQRDLRQRLLGYLGN
jgi:hypothetical protein